MGAEGADCEACPAGKYNPYHGAKSLYDCVDCECGKYSDVVGAGFDACRHCTPGKYAEGKGNSKETDCVACMAGKYLEATGVCVEPECLDDQGFMDAMGHGCSYWQEHASSHHNSSGSGGGGDFGFGCIWSVELEMAGYSEADVELVRGHCKRSCNVCIGPESGASGSGSCLLYTSPSPRDRG